MNKERLTSFFDAVLAIVMTILVLELQKPNSVSLAGFWDLRKNFFAYTLSFFWLGTMWVNHHNEWYRIKKINGRTVWAIIVMLFFSSLFPYATSIVSVNFDNATAQVFYGIIVICITLTHLLSYQTLLKDNALNPQVIQQMKIRNKWLSKDLLIKIIGLILAMTIYPPAMMYSVFLTLVVLVFPNQIRFLKQRQREAAEEEKNKAE